ncbi:hypothetical protein Cni_G24814 [Canna indica]|uniref:ARM repeat superfamily protein n=1 Tax=Canna indica TaxID=4628 RepID=A0AAQ3KVW1_9LILI|nr:hypothetical protein Cni_G24814 [Canna indica]
MEQSIHGEPGAIPLQILEQCSVNGGRSIKLGDNYGFHQDHIEDVEAPERQLTLFALRLAVLEKAASGLGTLGFIWATVDLLGGFAIALEKDFWCITIILLIEGARIFSRSHELEWQHQATGPSRRPAARAFELSSPAAGFSFRSLKLVFRPLSVRTSSIVSGVDPRSQDGMSSPPRWGMWQSSGDVSLLRFSGWVFLSRNASRVLYWLQLLAAAACISLSLARLAQQDFGWLRPDDPDKKNRKAALNMFYSLALAEALLFLAEKAYWEWKVTHRRLLEEVNRECHLGDAGVVSIKRFFYDAYSKCVEGTIFGGLKMDLVTFAEELLGSISRDEQLIGVRILLQFSTSHRFSAGTLRKLGTSTAVIERLIEMLNWKNPAEIKRSAAVIVSKLAGKRQNALRVAGIPGAMESFSSLLHTGQCSSNSRTDEVTHLSAAATDDHETSKFVVFNHLGLSILKKLANDHDNCGKIGNTRGLLAKIIGFTGGSGSAERLGRSESSTEQQVKAVKRSLQGDTAAREKHLPLQKLGIEVLTSLAMDEAAREQIGNTGGVIKELLRVFFAEGFTQQQRTVKVEAGEALAMLATESKNNCARIVKETRVVERLVQALDESVPGIKAARILCNLCMYAGEDDLFCFREVTAGIGVILNAIMTAEMELLEASLGLSAQVFKFMDAEEFAEKLQDLNISEVDFGGKLVQILHQYNWPSIKVPRMRSFVIEIAIWMMNSDRKYIKLLRDVGMEKELKCVAETTSELECFNVFSGSVGLSRHGTPLCSFVDAALELMMTTS